MLKRKVFFIVGDSTLCRLRIITNIANINDHYLLIINISQGRIQHLARLGAGDKKGTLHH